MPPRKKLTGSAVRVRSGQKSITRLWREANESPSSGGHRAYSSLYRQLKPMVLREAAKNGVPLHDRSDIVQESLIALARRKSRTGIKTNGRLLRGYVGKAAYAKSMQYWRDRSRSRLLKTVELAEVEGLADDVSEFWAALETAEREDLVRIALNEAPFGPKTKEAFARTALGGESPTEVAEQLELKPNAVNQYKHRVTKWLTDKLSQQSRILRKQRGHGE